MDLFHKIALEEYILAMQENKHGDSDYVEDMVYKRYEAENKMFDLFGNASTSNTESLGIPYKGSKRKYADKLICKMLELKPHSKYFYDLFGGA